MIYKRSVKAPYQVRQTTKYPIETPKVEPSVPGWQMLEAYSNVSRLIADLTSLKDNYQGKLENFSSVIENKITEIDLALQNILSIKKGDKGETPEVDYQGIIDYVLSNVKDGAPGRKGDNAIVDYDKLIPEVTKNLASKIKARDGKTPIIDYPYIIKSVVDTLPKQEDNSNPELFIEKFTKTGKKIPSKMIDGLEQTLSAYRSQLSKGYLHGAGITGLTEGTNITLVPDGKGGYIISATSGGTSNIYTEAPTGDIDGVNTAYTVLHTINSVITFAINGQYIHPSEYTFTGTTVTFNNPLDASLSGKEFTIVYS